MGFLDFVHGSKTVDKIVAELRATTLAQRQSLIAEAAAIQSAGESACSALAAELAKAVGALDMAKRAVNAAQAAHGIAASAFFARDRQMKTALSNIAGALERDSDLRIGVFIERLQVEADGRRHSMSEQSPLYFAGLMAAHKKAAALRVLAMTDDELTAALAAIKAEIPSQFSQAAA
jgi:hypothetical protein